MMHDDDVGLDTTSGYCGGKPVKGMVTSFSAEGSEVYEVGLKGKSPLNVPDDKSIQKCESKFADRQPPSELKPIGHQVKALFLYRSSV